MDKELQQAINDAIEVAKNWHNRRKARFCLLGMHGD